MRPAHDGLSSGNIEQTPGMAEPTDANLQTSPTEAEPAPAATEPTGVAAGQADPPSEPDHTAPMALKNETGSPSVTADGEITAPAPGIVYEHAASASLARRKRRAFQHFSDDLTAPVQTSRLPVLPEDMPAYPSDLAKAQQPLLAQQRPKAKKQAHPAPSPQAPPPLYDAAKIDIYELKSDGPYTRKRRARRLPPTPDPWLEDTMPMPVARVAKPRSPLFYALLILLSLALLITASMGIAQKIHENKLRLAEEERQRAWELERARHPFEYRDLVEDYASEQGLDPAFVAALILNESSYNPKAVSRVGARGLMQIMEDTAEWIAGKLRETNGYTFDRMFDPETNIRFGTWFLGYLKDRFDGDPVLMLAGYHAGGGKVSEWLVNPAYSADGETLHTIPISETDRYVQRVMTAYDVYKKHYYPEPAPEDTTDDSAGVGTDDDIVPLGG